jgi:hypothetical protein
MAARSRRLPLREVAVAAERGSPKAATAPPAQGAGDNSRLKGQALAHLSKRLRRNPFERPAEAAEYRSQYPSMFDPDGRLADERAAD